LVESQRTAEKSRQAAQAAGEWEGEGATW